MMPSTVPGLNSSFYGQCLEWMLSYCPSYGRGFWDQERLGDMGGVTVRERGLLGCEGGWLLHLHQYKVS